MQGVRDPPAFRNSAHRFALTFQPFIATVAREGSAVPHNARGQCLVRVSELALIESPIRFMHQPTSSVARIDLGGAEPSSK